jgi:CubicO group peptidase (beta-lactamase class C family)
MLGAHAIATENQFLADGFADVAIRARELLREEIAKVPGASIAVAVRGQLVWSESFGWADIDRRVPVRPVTRFRAGSVSKCFTAAGLMLLVERGRLDLDVPVQTYVREFPRKPEGVITARLLAGHLAGIRHYRGAEPGLNRLFPSVRDGLKLFDADPLVAAPGTQFHYSSYGWALLSAAMETAAKQDFLTYMDTAVFRPLHLTHTRPDRTEADDPDRAGFYKLDPNGKFAAAPVVDSSYMWAGGGFLSTAEDLAAFGSALLRPGFLRAESLTALFTSQKTSAGKATGYGIGWFIGGGGRVFYHTGGHQGSTSLLLIRPETGAVVAMLCNLADASLIDQGLVIADLFALPKDESASPP